LSDDLSCRGSHPLDIHGAILDAGDVQAGEVRLRFGSRIVDIELWAETRHCPISKFRAAVVVVHRHGTFSRAHDTTEFVADEADVSWEQHRNAVASSRWRTEGIRKRRRDVDNGVEVAAFEHEREQAPRP
ncbi:hypothetical protein, partial [Bradyrhizobium sp. NBAIM08]|uniref:hypothetical protein n=1 Tax=Bradyrhizobium sp. NBAIM08 TaxID=2793815 RepID=UPI001CD33DA1